MERKTLKQEKEQDEALVREALLGLSRSYAPYSHFHVSMQPMRVPRNQSIL